MPNAAQTYFNSFSSEAQDQIKESWGGENLMQEWFQNAKEAGAVGSGGGGGGDKSGGGENSGKVTVDDVRANAKKYNLPEDFARFDDNQVRAWLRDFKYDSATGKFTNKYGDKVDKPDERGPNTPHNMNGTGDQGDYGWGYNDSGIGMDGRKKGGGGADGKGGAGAPAGAPAEPVTQGKQLSYTGDPMTDMLLYQFNNTQLSGEAGQGQNIMGLGMDNKAGGEGADADDGGMAQLLKGGGLWRGMEDTFSGFRADQENLNDGKKKKKKGRGKNRNSAAVAPTSEEIANPPGAQPTVAPDPSTPNPTNPIIPDYKSDVLYGGKPKGGGMQDMMKNNFGSNFGAPEYL